MKAKKEYFIQSVPLIKINERSNIPTALFYESSGFLFGYDAIERATSQDQINENFKVDLGQEDISNINRKQYSTAEGALRSAHALTNDFVHATLRDLDKWVQARGLKKANRILVAEPIAMGTTQALKDAWLTNYRAHLNRILHNHFDEVDFLPEPFAVFQYYRYGLRHPLVAEKKKHIALVLDFGGGTCDATVIETTATGDVSMGGRHSLPLGANSAPIGGFYINRAIAEYLLFRNFDKKADSSRVKTALKKYDELRNANVTEVSNLSEDIRHFIRHFRALVGSIENYKIAICRQIADWRLDATFTDPPAVQITIPSNLLQAKPALCSVRLSAIDLRELFEKKVWEGRNGIKSVISVAIERARPKLEGKSISIVLLSGGSANIGWLAKLMDRDLRLDLRDAELLELQENFQEIVGKGLAVECARRTYTEGAGDFRSVTYNRLCLVVVADSGAPEIVQFKPATIGLPELSPEDKGVLLPSATGLGGFIDKPIRWKFRIGRPPRQKLEYYFLRSSFDTESTANLFNIRNAVYTPKNSGFDSQIQVELTMRPDGTTIPKFIYRQSGPETPGVEVTGEPFYMDMTFSAESVVGDAYIGFDFGTSNSCFSYVEQDAVKVCGSRAQDGNWREVSDLAQSLPYPVATSLARFIGEVRGAELPKLGLACFESFLALACFITYAEFRAVGNRGKSKLFSGLRQRSAGPLWAFFQQAMTALGARAEIASEFKRLLEEPYKTEIEQAIAQIANFKHEKESAINYLRLFWILGNTTSRVFQDRLFGYFESVKQKRFTKMFSGLFRVAHGPAQANFMTTLAYEGAHSFSDAQAFIYDQTSEKLFSLEPLFLWYDDQFEAASDSRDLYVFDTLKKDIFEYKKISQRKTLEVDNGGELSELYNLLQVMLQEDQPDEVFKEIKLAAADREA